MNCVGQFLQDSKKLESNNPYVNSFFKIKNQNKLKKSKNQKLLVGLIRVVQVRLVPINFAHPQALKLLEHTCVYFLNYNVLFKLIVT